MAKIWPLAILTVKAIFEIIYGICLWPLRSLKEVPQIYFISSETNTKVLRACDSILKCFEPSPWAPGCASQTLFAAFKYPKSTIPYSRKDFVAMDDGANVILDWKEPKYIASDAPIVVVCHGIEGSSDSYGVRWFTDMAFRSGWRSVVFNRRGHGGASILPMGKKENQLRTIKAYPMHCDTQDMNSVAQFVKASFPEAHMVLVGFSAGANLVVKYLGEYKDSPFCAGASICNGHELDPLTMQYQNDPIANALMTAALQRLLVANLIDLKEICTERSLEIDWKKLLEETDVRAFEEQLMLPLYPEFKSLKAFYVHNSSHGHFKHITVPLLSLASLDDLLIRPDLARHAAVASKINSNIFSIITKQGGHLGWLTGWKGRWWMMDLTFCFLKAILDGKQPKEPVAA